MEEKMIKVFPNSLIINVEKWEMKNGEIEEIKMQDNYIYETNGELLIIHDDKFSYKIIENYHQHSQMQRLEKLTDYILFSRTVIAQKLLYGKINPKLKRNTRVVKLPWLDYKKIDGKHFVSLNKKLDSTLAILDNSKKYYIASPRGVGGHHRHCSDPKKGDVWWSD